jgi:poly-gamma-glutamate capsule biosynthesis protein CapA/YwtB (metallophosphatase superfamily)
MNGIASFITAVSTIFSLYGGGLYANLASVMTPLFTDSRPHVLFVGDLMFDRSIRTAMRANGDDYIFSCIDGTLQKADLVVGNLEGPITESASRSVGSKVGSPDNFVFTFPQSVAPLLARHNIKAVALGNNHILNFGFRGVASTRAALENAGVGYFGDPGDQSVLDYDLHGIPLTFINYNQFYSGSTASTTRAQIKAARAEGRIPIVFAHWGDEYSDVNQLQKELAHSFVDSGAELVIGAHPHVIQSGEIYKQKYIYYSLGNFVFDQYWDDAVRDGLIVDVAFDPSGVAHIESSHVELEKDRRTCPSAS